MKNKDVLWTGFLMGFSFVLFLFTNFFCENSCYLFIGDGRVGIFVQWLIWLVIIMGALFLFSRNILVLWMRHIAWWYMYFTPWFVVNFSDGMFFSEQWLMNSSMTILLIITLIYALIMNRRLKKNVQELFGILIVMFNKSFYRFLFGFLAIIATTLVAILVAGSYQG